MKNKDIMGKVIKITEEELHNIIKTKIQEALEHNVDLEYSPAIGNKKRGPGKDTMDQMKKRRNTKLDEGLDEKPIYRRLPDGDLDYDGDDGEDTSGSGTMWVDIPNDSYAYALKKVFGEVPENLEEYLEENELMDEIEVSVSLDITEYSGDYWTPGGAEAELEDWSIVSDLSQFSDELKKVIYLATYYEIEAMNPMDIADKLNESKDKRLDNLISESFRKTLKNFLKK